MHLTMLICVKLHYYLLLCNIFLLKTICCDDVIDGQPAQRIDPSRTKIWGPGLKPDEIMLPVRYFFIQAIDDSGKE